MLHGILTQFANANLVGGPVPYTMLAVSGSLVGFLISQTGLRSAQPLRHRLLTVTSVACGGMVLGAATFIVVAVWWNPFGIPVPRAVAAYLIAVVAGVSIAVLSLHRARWWRRILSGLTVAVLLVTATVTSVAAFGMNPTVGSLFGRTSVQPFQPLAIQPFPPMPGVPNIAATWRPPAGMPQQGRLATVEIPPVHSGFVARPAGLYLPPAALVANAPRLPLVILMMGQPGSPDPSYVGNVLNQFAATHRGLAPIVVVADQLGDSSHDTACSNSAAYGNVETYITRDVLEWADANLHVEETPATRTIAGYSNGGGCALLYAAKYPELFRNLMDISGEIVPGSDDPAAALQTVFHGNQVAYDAQKPATILRAHRYPKSVAVFTAGSDDVAYVAAARAARADARAAGFDTRYAEIPHGGHVGAALPGGFADGFTALYPRLGLG